MNITARITLFALTILSLGSISLPSFANNTDVKKSSTQKLAQQRPDQKSVMSADQAPKDETKNSSYLFGLAFQVSRSTSLYDHKDGTNSESMSFLLAPSFKMPFGSISALFSYNQDLKDSENIDNGFADTPVAFAFKTKEWDWSAPYILTLTPTITALAPMAKRTVTKDQLQTALSTGLSFGIKPDGIHTSEHGEYSLAIGVTAGRNFHTYEEDINGAVLNKYSSNQTINLGYSISEWSFAIEYIHKTRWTYKGNIKDAFSFSQELGYTFNDHFAAAIGHSNEGAGLKSNGYESNFNLIDENASSVYLSLGTSL